jgi:1-deoxy-D-xylulose-5-phosphate reductoisomerase
MDTRIRNIAILGSTGSIGQQTLDIVRRFPDRFRVIGLACGTNARFLARQIQEFKPEVVGTSIKTNLPGISKRLSLDSISAHPDVDLVVIATTGRVGLNPTLAAIKAGKTIALANKEILAMAGELISRMTHQYGAKILPIDSEHSAILQCLQGEESGIHRLLLTASGGPFYGMSGNQLKKVTVDEALAHPTWKMGKKVTIDSATLFNKGLEAIEAHWLFSIPYERIEIVVHRQSIVHSMVEFEDRSIKAQLSVPDMHLPIQYALFYPERIYNEDIQHLSFDQMKTLTFEPVNYDSFPCLKLALEAGEKGGTYPAVLCAADEIAVELFLQKNIGFAEIAKIIERTLNLHLPTINPELEDIVIADGWARETALKIARKEV